MTINEAAVREIFNREGALLASKYLIESEHFSVIDAHEFVAKHFSSESLTTQKPELKSGYIYYCLKCNQMEQEEVCTRNAITRFFAKVKEGIFL